MYLQSFRQYQLYHSGKKSRNSLCRKFDFFTLQINNIITPNEDGINDVLDLKALEFENFTGSVYDRYGVEMFRFQKKIQSGTEL
jgi:hypothetical protein